MRFVSATLLLLATCLSAGCTGCSSTQPAAPLTPTQQLAKEEYDIRVASTLATKLALVSMSPTEADAAAATINTVAKTIASVADQPDFVIGLVRTTALKQIASDPKLSAKQKQVVGQVLDTVVLLVQDHLSNTPLPVSDSVRGFVKAAAGGASDATDAWVGLPSTPTTAPAKIAK